MKYIYNTLILVILAGSLGACRNYEEPNQVLAEYVDLERFMGKWYVQGYTPTALDRNAWNPTESYELLEDGRIQTTYQFRKGGEAGKLKTQSVLNNSKSGDPLGHKRNHRDMYHRF